MRISVDDLAQEIRRVDGRHDLGAGALAEALLPFIAARLRDPAGAQADEVVCLECGQTTMHMGQVCYACSHPAAHPADAQAQGGRICTHPEGFTHCGWCGAQGEQAQGCGEVVAHGFYDPATGAYSETQRTPRWLPAVVCTAPPSAPVGVEAPADEFSGDTPHLIRCIESLLRLDAAGALVPHGVGGHARTMLAAAAKRLAQQPAAEQDCDNCGGFGDVSGEYPGDACPDCRGTGKVPAQQPAAGVGEEIMVNAAHDVYTLPLQPSGLSSGPRFVVHVPGPEQPAAVDGADARDAEIEALLREAAELARRFEGAPVAVVECNDAKGAWLVAVDDAPLYKGQRLRLVPEAGQGGGDHG